MPDIVLLNRFYWPDESATAQLLTDLAEDLIEAGWSVTVISSGSEYRPVGRTLQRREVRNGVKIIRTRSAKNSSASFVKRMQSYSAYLVGVAGHLLLGPRYDAIVAMSDPPLLVVVAATAARLRSSRSIYWLQDLFPEIAVRLGVLRARSIAYRAARAADHWARRRVDLLITLGPRMAQEAISTGARPEHTAIVHNWTDASIVIPVAPAANPFIAEHTLTGKFVVLYSGNAGRAHTFDAILDAAALLVSDPDIVFVFVGTGAKMLEIAAAARRLPNIRIIDFVPREVLRYSLSSGSVSLVTENPSVVGHLVPSKLYGILASARPVLFIGSEESDVATIVRTHTCGVVLGPTDVDGIVAAIKSLRSDPERAAAMGARGRAAAETCYDRKIATRAWREAVLPILDLPRAPS